MNAISCAGSVDNLIVLDQEKYKSRVHALGGADSINMSGQYKWKVGELEFESLMRMLDNLVSVRTDAVTVWTLWPPGSSHTHTRCKH